MMRLLHASLIAVLLSGCRSVPADLPVERHEAYIREIILPQAPQASDHCIVLVINKHFCGSCTDHAISLLHAPSLTTMDVIAISDQDITERLPDSLSAPRLTRLVIPLDVQQRKGFFSTMNRIYFIEHGHIEAANYITEETIANVSRQLTRWASHTAP